MMRVVELSRGFLMKLCLMAFTNVPLSVGATILLRSGFSGSITDWKCGLYCLTNGALAKSLRP